MPWKASSVMDERLRFVARLLDGEATTEVCREFGISGKTGYRIFERFKEHGYNNERPHQALNMQCPAERYQPSSRPYRGLPDLDYPLHDKAATVTTCGRICFK